MNRLPNHFKTALKVSPSNSAGHFSTCSNLLDKATYNRQGKIMSKLFGNRVSGSKRRWFENPINSSGHPTMDSPFNFNNPKKSNPGSIRRVNVLNKLFMTHITDLLATGQASQKILGKGLNITRVKVSPNFQVCNVFWMSKGDVHDVELENELHKCGGMLRHELSQLRLMGEVPRIHFVRDKTFANLAHVETVLKTADFGHDHHKQNDPSSDVKFDLYQSQLKDNEKVPVEIDEEEPIPKMRHDVFGVDRRAIMLKILAKLKKSEDATQQNKLDYVENSSVLLASGSSPAERVQILKEKLEKLENDEAFNKYLQMKKAESMLPRKRRYQTQNEQYYKKISDDDYDTVDDGDFIEEDFDNSKK